MTDEQATGRWGPEQWSRRYPFAQVTTAVLRDPTLEPGPKTLYAVLCTYLYFGHDTAWPSQATLAEQCGVHERTIRKWMTTLKQAGLVTVEQRPGSTPLYRIWLGEAPAPQGQPDADNAAEGGPTGPPPPRPHRATKEEEVRPEEEEGTTLVLASPSAPPAQREKKQKKAKTPRPSEDWNALTAELREPRSRRVRAALDSWMLRAGQANQSGAITDARCYNETVKLLDVLDEVADEDAWCSGVDTTVAEAEKLNFKFLRSCIATAQKKRGEDGGFGGPRRLPVEDPARKYEAELMAEDAERERLAAEERKGRT